MAAGPTGSQRMRHLFVPACVCIMTLSGSTASDPTRTLDSFVGTSAPASETPRQRVASAAAEPEAWATIDAARRRAFGDDEKVSRGDISIPQQEPLQYFLGSHESGDNELREVEGPPAPPPKPVVHRSRKEVCETLASAAEDNNLPAPFFIRLLLQESGFRPGVVSPVGAQGVAQFMPDTAARMGVDNPFDPLQAIPASARLLRSLFEQFGNLGLAAAAYNAGPKRIQDWLAKKGKLPEETRGYVKIITGHEPESWKLASAAGISGIKLPRIAPCQREAGLHAWNGPDQIPMPPVPPGARGDVVVAAAGPARAESRLHKAAAAAATLQLAAHKTRFGNDAKRGKAAKPDGKLASKPAGKSLDGKSHDSKSSDNRSGSKPGKPLRLAGADK